VSWDVFIFCAPAEAASVGDIPQDFEPSPLGGGLDVLQRLRDSVPGLDLSDPTWGQLEGPTWSIELNIGSDDPIDSIMLHVRGSGDDVPGVIAQIADSVGGRALDLSTNDFLTGDPAESAGWQGFQQYRNRVIRDN
jgi:hypothetical protein